MSAKRVGPAELHSRGDSSLLRLLRRLEKETNAHKLKDTLENQNGVVVLARLRVGHAVFVLTGLAERPRGRLTPKEHQVALHAARGSPTKTIATALHMSQSTVETHLQRIFDKQEIHSRRELRMESLEESVATKPRKKPESERASPLTTIQSRLDQVLKSLVGCIAKELPGRDLGVLLVGQKSPVVLVDVVFRDHRYVLRCVAEPALPELTPREREIAVLLACDIPKRTIAWTLRISELTVKTRARLIFSKYHVGSHEDLTAEIMALGAGSPEKPGASSPPPGSGPGRN